jgi:branched chain amino acid efflux pump
VRRDRDDRTPAAGDRDDRTPAAGDRDPTLRATLIAAAPLGAAIGVFGVIFGASAGAEYGPALTIGMSLIVFSGTVQFAVVGLLASGAGAAAVLVTALALNMRNLVLGAAIRHRLTGSWMRRAGLAWLLVDESFGLAIASKGRAATVLLVTGALFYVTWQLGTILGVLGARVVALEGLAGAVFPVLFIGLAALTVRGRPGVIRALVAGGFVAVVAVALPALHAWAPIIAALLVALPEGRAR